MSKASVFTGLAAAASASLAAAAAVRAAGGLAPGGLASLPWPAIAGAAAVGTAVVLVPLLLLMDQRLARVARDLGRDRAVVPFWLRGVVAPMQTLVVEERRRLREATERLNETAVRLRLSEDRFRRNEAILDVIRDAVIVTDAFDEIIFANSAAERLFGFDRSEAEHRAVQSVVHDRELLRLVSDVRSGATPGDARVLEHELVPAARPAGRTATAPRGTPLEVALTGVADGRGGLAGVVTVLRDLSRERELAALRTDFVSKASHELRTPLSSIRAYVEMLVDGEAADEDARLEFYRVIQSETDRLSRLIDNLLNISRIEAGIVQVERETVDLQGIIAKAAETIEPQARERNIAVVQRIASVDLRVEGDPDMLLQVMLNLLSNAVKYTPEGGRVTVAADSDNLTRAVHVSVADTGLGIPPDAVPRLFQKFYRIENYKRIAPGTGLGLNLCKHIVETVHRGQIGVESTLGMGSRFWFTIPMHYAGAKAA